MGHTNSSRARARKRAGRRCAPTPVALAPANAPLPQSALELTPSPQPAPRRHSPLARALAVAVDVEAACEANDNAELEFVATVPETHALPAQETPPANQIVANENEEPPFDPPDADDEIFLPPTQARRWSDPDVLDLHTPAPPSFPHEPSDTRPPARPAPAISIHLSWDHPAGDALADTLAAEPLLSRADITDTRGGFGAVPHYLAKTHPPDLLIVDTTLKPQPLLEALDATQAALDARTKLFIIGDVNDVTLLRDLARRGIAQYFLAPAEPHEIARAICDAYAENDRSHVIAVVGSRGGAGASTVAHNLAWSIAERQDATATLIELDLAFGATAFGFDQRSTHSLAEGVRDPQSINEAFLDRIACQQTDRLRVIAAPASLDDGLELQQRTIGALIRTARRTSAYVILDVPHQWNACVKDVLERANDVVIVAPPDLASLRNTKSLMDVLKSLRPAGHEPMVALSMVGAAKGTEISERDFANALGAKPILALAFDPALFAGATLKRQMLAELAPHADAARQVDDFACVITGRKPVKRKKLRRTKPNAAEPPHRPPAQDALVLTTPATKRRSRARPLAYRHPKPETRRRPAQRGTLRLAAALMALLASGMWCVERHSDVHFISYAIASGR